MGEKYKKSRWWYCLPCVLFAGTRIKIYRDFQKLFVDKIVYNTEDKHFTLFKKSFFALTKE
jgi:hypothetical protein